MTVVNRFVQAVAHGGAMSKPTLIVIHSAETPLQAGYANSIATNWFGKASSGVTTSAHFMVDPVEIIRMLSDNVVSYAVGPKANGFTLNIEQAGYARFARADWTTTDGLTQLGKVGALIAELAAAHAIPLRFATDAQILAAAKGVPGGICFHDDIHRVLGGTTHTDPMPHYPADLLLQAATHGTPEDDVQLTDPIPNANPEGKAKAPQTTVANLWQDAQANAYYAARNTDGLPAFIADVRADLAAKAQQITTLTASNSALTQLVAQQNGLTVADVEAAVERAVAKGVDVNVSVAPGTAPAA